MFQGSVGRRTRRSGPPYQGVLRSAPGRSRFTRRQADGGGTSPPCRTSSVRFGPSAVVATVLAAVLGVEGVLDLERCFQTRLVRLFAAIGEARRMNQRAIAGAIAVTSRCRHADHSRIHPPAGGCSPVPEPCASQAGERAGGFTVRTAVHAGGEVSTSPRSGCLDTFPSRCLLMRRVFHHDSFGVTARERSLVRRVRAVPAQDRSNPGPDARTGCGRETYLLPASNGPASYLLV